MTKVKVEEIVRAYLKSLLSSHRFKKVTLAEAMATSRGQLNTALKTGRITVDHINGIAAATTGKVSSVLAELQAFAKEAEDKIVTSDGSKVGETVKLGKRSYIKPRVRAEKEAPRSEQAPLSRGTRRHRPH